MTQLTRRSVLSALGAIPLALAGCGGGGSGGGGGSSNVTFAAKSVVDNVSDNVITQTYKNLNAAAATLLANVQALKTGGATEPEMDTAQAGWKATRVPWESSEGFLFGPVDALGIDPSIDSWPLNTPDLQAFLASHPNATQTDIENASDDLRGFHAIEYLLFGDGVSDNEKAASELTASEINYLVALAQAFKARTQELEASWTTSFNANGPYATQLKSPGAGKTYTGYSAVLEEILTGLITISDEVGNAKLSEPLGTSAGTADTSLVESQYSWNSLTDFHNNIQSVLNVYTGKLGFNWQTDTASASQNGVFAFVNAHNPTLAARVVTEITDAQKAIALIKGDGDNTSTVITGSAKPFRVQIANNTGRALIATAIAACNKLRATLQGEVLPLLGHTTFTA